MTTLSIIIPVLNEAPAINGLIRHVKETGAARDREIIVVDGSPDRDTLKAMTDPDALRLSSPPGRAGQMNAGAGRATGEILLFLHADTQLPRNAFALIGEAMKRKDFVGGAFDLTLQSGRRVHRLIAAAASLRSRMTRIPYGDQAIFIRRDYFQRIGGYPDIPLMEDVALMARIKKAGDRICFISSPVRTSSRRWEREGVLRTTLRNWALVGLYHMGISPATLSRHYKSGRDAYEDRGERFIDE